MVLTRKQRYLRSRGARFESAQSQLPQSQPLRAQPGPQSTQRIAPPPVTENTMISVKDVINHHKAHEDIHRRGYEKFKDSEFPASQKVAEEHKRKWHHHAGVRTRYEAHDRAGRTHVSHKQYQADSQGRFASFSLSLVDEVVLAGVAMGASDRDWMKPKGVKPVFKSAKRAGSEFLDSAKRLVTPGNIGATAGMTLVFVIGSTIAMTAISLVLRGLGMAYEVIGNKIFVKPKNEQQAQKARQALRARGAKELPTEEAAAAFSYYFAEGQYGGKKKKPDKPDRFAQARAGKHARQVLPRAHYVLPGDHAGEFYNGLTDIRDHLYVGNHKITWSWRDWPGNVPGKENWVMFDVETDDTGVLHSIDNLAMRCKARKLDSRGNMEKSRIEPTARVASAKTRPDQLRAVFTFPEKQAKQLANQVRQMGLRVELKGYTFGRNYHVPAMIMMIQAQDERALKFAKKLLHDEGGANSREVGYGEWLRAVARDKGVPGMSLAHGARALRHAHGVGIAMATTVAHAPQMLGGLKKLLGEWGAARKAGDQDRLMSIWQKVQNILTISKGAVDNPGGVKVLAMTKKRNPLKHAEAMDKGKKSMPYDLGRWLSEKMPSLFPSTGQHPQNFEQFAKKVFA